MRIKLTIQAGTRTIAALRIRRELAPAEATHVRVAFRGPLALGWNRLYATLLAQAQHDGRTGDAASTWVRQILSGLSQIEGMRPDALGLEDLRYLLATPALGSVTLASDLAVDATLSALDARRQDLGDPYSPIDDPDPLFTETFFHGVTSGSRDGEDSGWWSPMEREPLAIGAPGGPGRTEGLDSSSDVASDEPPVGDLGVLGIDRSHRLMYLGQDRVLDWVPAATSQYRVWSYDRFGRAGASLAAILVEQQAWSTIDSGHELIWLGRDLQADPHSTDDLVLDWAPSTGDYRLYRVDLEGTKSDGTTPDILPEPSLTKGNWTSIRAGKKLVYLGGNRVLGWEPATGNFRIWVLDRAAATPNGDPLPNLEVQGTWDTLRDGHRIINLGGDRVLTWLPATGWYRVWRYDRSVRGNGDPLVSPPLVEGHLQDIGADHELIWLGGRDVLDWQPGSGAYRIRSFDRTVVSSNPLT